ncbi:MED20-like protein, partial [Mya arenaria]
YSFSFVINDTNRDRIVGGERIYAFHVPHGKSGQQVVDSLQRQLELMGAITTGIFSVDCETYQSNNLKGAAQRILHVLHNSEQPTSCFAILDNGTTLVADVIFELLVAKLTQSKSGKDGYYERRKGLKIESKGPSFELSDFIVKIGSVSMASDFKGILVEVEYCPCAIPGECWELMKEMMQSFMGTLVENPPMAVKNKKRISFIHPLTLLLFRQKYNNYNAMADLDEQIANKAIFFGFLASMLAMAMDWFLEGKLSVYHALLVCTACMCIAALASFVLGRSKKVPKINFDSPESRNWLKQWKAVFITRRALLPFVKLEAKRVHSVILQKASNIQTCLFDHGPVHNNSSMQCNFHKTLRDEILAQHEKKKPSWKNSSTDTWQDSPFAVAKLFMQSPGYDDKSSFDEIDFNGLAVYMFNCKEFTQQPSQTLKTLSD